MRRPRNDLGWPVVACVLVVGLSMSLGTLWLGSFRSYTHAFVVDLVLLLVVASATAAWVVVAASGRVRPDAAGGLLLAAFGVGARFYCDFLLHAFVHVHDFRSVYETHPSERLRFLVQVHRHGGLAAVAIGLALTAWAVAGDLRHFGRSAGKLRLG